MTMAIAPSAQESDRESGYITAAYADSDRLILVFGVNIDPDLPPLPSDLCVVAGDKRIGAASLEIQLDKEQAAVTLLLEVPLQSIGDDKALVVRYRPTQWLMCVEETGEAIEAFDEEIFPQPITELDPELRPNIQEDASSQTKASISKLVEANIRSASEYRIQLYFNDYLDTSMPLEVSDFRAELQDRWLHITSAKYIKSHSEDCPEIRLELSEPMETGGVVQVGYRSPGNRLRTLDAEPLAPFSVSARVDRTLGHHIQDDEAELESVAVTLNEQEPELQAERTLSVPEGEDAVDLIAELDSDALETEADFEPDSVLDELDAMTDELASDETADRVALEKNSEQNSEGIVADVALEDDRVETVELEEPVTDDAERDISDDVLESDVIAIDASDENEPLLSIDAPEDESADGAESDELIEEAFSGEEVLDELASAEEQSEPGSEIDGDIVLEEALPPTEIDTKSVAKEVIAGNLEEGGAGDAVLDDGEEEVDASHAETIAEKAARIQKALESKSALPVTKPPLSLAAKFFYIIPMVVFAWLLIVIFIYVATIVFDLNLGGSAEGPEPIVALPSKVMPRETCSMRSADGSQYKGQCLNGKREGQGVYTWATGNRYEGQWHNGQRHGQGVLNYATGAVYQGEYRAGVEHGSGKMAWPNGAVYEGAYAEGKFHGKGLYISADGSRFEGMFDSGSMTQDGECTLPSGEKTPGPCVAK
ncbi:MAG: hypothetical protein K6L81_10380 [Agarilytica sp.]